jgi:hypothetical protein
LQLAISTVALGLNFSTYKSRHLEPYAFRVVLRREFEMSQAACETVHTIFGVLSQSILTDVKPRIEKEVRQLPTKIHAPRSNNEASEWLSGYLTNDDVDLLDSLLASQTNEMNWGAPSPQHLNPHPRILNIVSKMLRC